MQKKELTFIIQEAIEGGYIAYVKELPGINSQGETVKEAENNLIAAMDLVRNFSRAKKKLKRKR